MANRFVVCHLCYWHVPSKIVSFNDSRKHYRHVDSFRSFALRAFSKFSERRMLFLVKHLALLFIPATVGVMEYFSLFQSKGILTVFIVIISTVLVMSISSFVSQMTAAKKSRLLGRMGVIKAYEK